jgi:mono/diheme cytochrome c family protein
MLTRHGGDAFVFDATLSGLRGSETEVLEAMGGNGGSGGTDQPPPRLRRSAVASAKAEVPPSHVAAVTAMLAATIIRGAQDAAIQDLFTLVGDPSRPSWQRAAVLQGAEIALLGAPMPGTPAARAANTGAAPLPCPTCPGGRGGPGGAYAFGGPPARPRDAGGPRLRLTRQPGALATLALQSGDLGTRATAVLARISWPGKPGEATLPPLTHDEQQRFAAGREVYRNLCQACHQPDGRGQDKLAPSLIGSTLALAPADIPARVLLNGKEGSIGLMPPIGAAISDEQIASVLTYIRREWGQGGTPVHPATVQAIRAYTTGRSRPWTDAELLALLSKE